MQPQLFHALSSPLAHCRYVVLKSCSIIPAQRDVLCSLIPAQRDVLCSLTSPPRVVGIVVWSGHGAGSEAEVAGPSFAATDGEMLVRGAEACLMFLAGTESGLSRDWVGTESGLSRD